MVLKVALLGKQERIKSIMAIITRIRLDKKNGDILYSRFTGQIALLSFVLPISSNLP